MGKHMPPGEDLEPVERPRKLILKRIAMVLGILILGCVATLAGMSVAQRKPVWQIVATALTPSPQQVFGKSHILVLIEGLDYDMTRNNAAARSACHLGKKLEGAF